MPRLFVAFGLPQLLRDSLALTRGGLENARWIDPSDYHVTLRFIGDVDNARADRLAEALEMVEAESFTARTESYGCFGGDKPRIVHLGLHADPELVVLQQKVEFACRAAGFEPEGRKFTPHITIARMRRKGPEDIAHWLSSRMPPIPQTFRVENFSLYVARTGGGGPYHPIVEYPLD
ncbi:RNA 2',3'-cyclic phosphodiesterase [Parvularcula flava]|uniref:RNA 2',3'-cyclic phosphodiesterase n=1 Tax=Aquisalinus luteolus TaxID=1566827 RepID=A0A8J3A3G0_9PROT|nr:RNA 2',3'-cyclic phosphodiesterase [Aquisalinus luteolus]NHK29136.1 RNA 2',3'-cyclic phosphodiesterase [Aquisalinus luteolus]GGI00197.1 RNA 2',3'-cyclic phosphodiesterase [Aquisalinus luteolus]